MRSTRHQTTLHERCMALVCQAARIEHGIGLERQVADLKVVGSSPAGRASFTLRWASLADYDSLRRTLR